MNFNDQNIVDNYYLDIDYYADEDNFLFGDFSDIITEYNMDPSFYTHYDKTQYSHFQMSKHSFTKFIMHIICKNKQDKIINNIIKFNTEILKKELSKIQNELNEQNVKMSDIQHKLDCFSDKCNEISKRTNVCQSQVEEMRIKLDTFDKNLYGVKRKLKDFSNACSELLDS